MQKHEKKQRQNTWGGRAMGGLLPAKKKDRREPELGEHGTPKKPQVRREAGKIKSLDKLNILVRTKAQRTRARTERRGHRPRDNETSGKTFQQEGARGGGDWKADNAIEVVRSFCGKKGK